MAGLFLCFVKNRPILARFSSSSLSIDVCLYADQAENRSFKPVFRGFCLESDRAAQKIRGAAQKIRGAARRFFPPDVFNRLKRAPGLESWSLIYSIKTNTGLKMPVFNWFYVYTT